MQNFRRSLLTLKINISLLKGYIWSYGDVVYVHCPHCQVPVRQLFCITQRSRFSGHDWGQTEDLSNTLESFPRDSHINLPLGQSHQWRCCSILRFYKKHMFVCSDIRLEWLRVRVLPSAQRNRLTASAKRILPPRDTPLINAAKTDELPVPRRAPPPPPAHPHPLIHL